MQLTLNHTAVCLGVSLLSLAWSASRVNAQSVAPSRPTHGIEVGIAWTGQFPGHVSSDDGSDAYVAVSNWASGYRIAVSYLVAITEGTSALLGLHVGGSSSSFTWGGEQAVLGSFGDEEGEPTGFVENWEIRGASLGCETAIFTRKKFKALASVSAGFDLGSGGATFVWREPQPNGSGQELFRYDVLFNAYGKVMTSIRPGLTAEWTRPNFNRFRFGFGYTAMFARDNLRGTYFARTFSQGPLSGSFTSSMSGLYIHAGYLFSWGYPKVPKRVHQ